MLENIMQMVVYGVCRGGLYGLGAVGLALIFGVMEVLQVSHGTMIMLGAYMCFWLFCLFQVDPLLSVPLVMLMFFFVGMVLYRGFFSPLIKLPGEGKLNSSMLIAFGLLLIIDNMVIVFWTADIRTVTPFYQGLAFELSGVRFPYVGLAGLVLAGVLIFALHLFLRRTYFGKAIRAVTQNWEAASLMGVKIHWIYSLSMGIGTAMAAAAGVIVILGSGVDPSIGMQWTLKSMLIMVLAGTGNIGGVFVCGLFFGILESVSGLFIGLYKELIGLVLFMVVLIWRPQGLFGRGSS